jgi:hypothetical protein
MRNHFNTPILQKETKKKRGHLYLLPNIDGISLTWDFNKQLSQNLKNYSYFYVISINCPCVDPLDSRGKVKLGYSSAQATMNTGFTQRLVHWQRVYGASTDLKLHMLVLFQGGSRYLPEQFESQVKDILHKKNYIQNGANIQLKNGVPYVHKTKHKAEFFRMTDLNAVLNTAMDVYNNPKNKIILKITEK